MEIGNLLLSKKVIVRYTLFILFSLLCTNSIQAQELTVQGIVTSVDDGTPIPGVSVLVKGTSNGSTTDFDGVYTITCNMGDILVFSYLGMNDQSLKVKGAKMTVALSTDVEDLDEVVVIGYGSVKKKELTGAVTQIKAEDLERTVTSDLGDALQGQAAGVNVVTSSTPGGDSEILIRGVTSLGDNTPLYVVDGIIQEGDPRISPTDIETINVLKDAASTAIYGSRGATGVILITTKQGKAGTLQIRLNASYGIQHAREANPLMNSLEQSYFDIVTQRNVVGAYDDEVILRMSQDPYSFQNETDLNDIIFANSAPTQNYNANISGGTNDITYNVSVGFYDQRGLMLNSGFKRFNTRANTVYKKNKLRIQSSLSLSNELRDIPQNSLIIQSIKYFPTQNSIDLDSNDDLESLGGADSNRLGWVLNSMKTTETNKAVRTSASFRIDYDVLKDLKVNANIGFGTINMVGKRFVPYQEVTNLQNGNVSNPSDSYVRQSSDARTSLSLEVGATYNTYFNEDHHFTAAAFFTSEKYTRETFYAQRAGVLNPDIQVLHDATLEMDVDSGTDYTDKLLGTIGRVQYDYKGKYLISASVRADGSSKFDEDNKWGVFPSVSAAWNISDELFWDNMKSTVNSFRFRISQGTVGNQRIGSYLYAPVITQSINNVVTNGNEEVFGLGATQTSFSNKDLQWETTAQTNVGIDLSFLKNKISFTAEYYNTSKKDMLFPVILAPSVGGGQNANVTLNVGNMVNRGVELAAGYRGSAGKGKFRYRLNATFATNDNEITKINGQTDFLFTNDWGLVNGARDQSQVTALAVGHEAGAFYLLRTDGILDTDNELSDYQTLVPSAEMGDVKYINSNGDDTIDGKDRVYSGSGLPNYEIGFNVGANYKSFDFYMNWYAALGHEIMNGAKATAYAYGRSKDLVYQWSPQNTETTIPAYRGDIKKHTNFLGYSDLWLEDGSYLRLRTLTFGYSLPKKTLEKAGIGRLRFYISAQNIWTITNYSGYNPEVGGGVASRGLDKGVGPTPAMFLLGLNFNF